VDLGRDGDTVKVCPSIYEESVTVDESIFLLGAQAGVDARTRSGMREAAIDHPDGALRLEADDVVVDGFTIQPTNPESGSVGIFTSPIFAGYEIRNNILRGNVAGIHLNSSGTHSSFVQQNLFKNNNAPGEPLRSGTGIYSDLGLDFAYIEENKFEGHTQASVNLSAGRFGSVTSQSEITIADNLLVEDHSIALYNTTFASIVGNVVRDLSCPPDYPLTSRSAVFIGGGVKALDILANDFLQGCRGISVRTGSSEPAPNSDIVARFNSFVGNDDWAIFVLNGAYDGILDARRNWWGHSTGPRHWSTGSGDPVGAGVRFFPWSTNASFGAFSRCSNPFTRRDDIIRGTSGNDILCGGGGDDLMYGGPGNDLLLGGSGNDVIRGQGGNDALIGDAGNDFLNGGPGVDRVQGWAGTDVCLEENVNKSSCEG
jgi:Ca2+-binding RTX toxin-like protein